MTILLATLVGMPTSTTHALTGALVGAALIVDAGGIDWHWLLTSFAQPLLLSPILAIAVTAIAYPNLRWLRRRWGVTRQTCLCVGNAAPQPVTITADGVALLVGLDGERASVTLGRSDRCVERYQGRFIGIDAQRVVDSVHYVSGGAVCFARAVNDTPKIAALLLAGSAMGALQSPSKLLLIALAMATGGVLQARQVAETMSKRITDLNSGQGLTANLVTAGLVLVASRLGMPVSTTHVSCGSIFGIGLVNRKQHWKTVAQILLTWVTTLPLGLALGAAFHLLFRTLGA